MLVERLVAVQPPIVEIHPAIVNHYQLIVVLSLENQLFGIQENEIV